MERVSSRSEVKEPLQKGKYKRKRNSKSGDRRTERKRALSSKTLDVAIPEVPLSM